MSAEWAAMSGEVCRYSEHFAGVRIALKVTEKLVGGVKLRILHMLSYIAFCSSVVASVHRYVTEGNVATELTNRLLFEFPQSDDVSARYARSSVKVGVRIATIQNFFSKNSKSRKYEHRAINAARKTQHCAPLNYSSHTTNLA